MGEYIKYKGEEVKIGTVENLYYVTYPQMENAFQKGLLETAPNNCSPQQYLNPDSGFRFRFPFPDEDGFNICDSRYQYDRGVSFMDYYGQKVEIVQQKLLHRQSDNKLCLALVLRDSERNRFRIEDDADVKEILKQIIRSRVINSSDTNEIQFYREIARRILSGYILPEHALKATRPLKKNNVQRNRKRGPGI
ncbi:hypothetical protein [Chitinophaga polysaccharea]|uniref:hypothetical protein n=1 Tax=Chitinophaga polysaccharea TaxID=1293035 RepID=UPI001156E909|nr:hypothetical protein [Chitinophaga polysaccharea]